MQFVGDGREGAALQVLLLQGGVGVEGQQADASETSQALQLGSEYAGQLQQGCKMGPCTHMHAWDDAWVGTSHSAIPTYAGDA